MQGITLTRTNSEDPHFAQLVKLLDKDLLDRYGEKQDFFGQFNKLDTIKHVIVACIENEPVACGAIKQYDPSAAEVKRMFVKEAHRRKGIARQVLTELENWAAELGFSSCILETATGQPEAIQLYQQCGYEVTPNYGQYVGVEISVCMKKELTVKD